MNRSLGSSRDSTLDEATSHPLYFLTSPEQFADMQKEMAAMRKTIEGSGDIPAQQRPMMQQHMGQMEKNWQGMHDQCCMMNPAGCSQKGATSSQ